ncbi:MFS transporter [Bacillus songklensis]|uniref:MFS transporter n=1 Tax=Bacillus songklensis TaxID=1069116 RepID=A0ABV8B3Z5_9BACI
MSQPNYATTSDSKSIMIPKYLVISLLTLFSFGPQYFLNLSYILNQTVIQNGLNLSAHDMLLPSVMSNLAFALGVPLGRVLSMKYGIRRNYLTFIFIFFCGSIINSFSSELISLIIGRTIQGFSAGVLFLTILPVSLKSYPNKVRNLFLFFAIGGLFGSSAVGAFFGSLSLSTNTWRWLFIFNLFSSLLCLLIGYAVLPKHQPKQHDNHPVDRRGVFLLCLIVMVLAFPLSNLQEKGFGSVYVWPLLLIAMILSAMFINVDLHAENPLVPLRSLWAAKPVSGTIMAISSHVALVVAIAGINGFLRNIINPPFMYLSYFYIWFFAGIMAAAILSTLLYDRLGAGILGVIGSLAVIVVGIQWKNIGAEASLNALYVQIACLGGGVSMVLISGALGTALAGDIHKATMRSASLHSMRNFIGAVSAPLLGWFVYRANAVHYENIRGQVSLINPEINRELAELTHRFMDSGLTAADAKNMAIYSVVVNARKASILGAYHDLFTILLVLGVIMMVASIGKAVTGKGRSLVQKEARVLLPAPSEKPKMDTTA